MIRINLLDAVALFISVPIILVFVWIIFYNYYRRTDSDDQTAEQCPYCTYVVYSFFKNDLIWTCPQCKSLVHRENSKINERLK